MKDFATGFVRLLLLGAGPRLLGAVVIMLLLWSGFLWATAPLGGG